MNNLEETKEFLKRQCLQRCNHNSNESCICKVAICFKEIEKSQEQEKALKIIFEKRVNIVLLELSENVYEYNERIAINSYILIEKEFDLLKRWLG